ncbi:hypothetical protein GCM10028895_48540 [Pontibacter rugosus]
MTYIPSATYRLQTNPNFKLSDIRQIVPYLHELGISTVYSAPFLPQSLAASTAMM